MMKCSSVAYPTACGPVALPACPEGFATRFPDAGSKRLPSFRLSDYPGFHHSQYLDPARPAFAVPSIRFARLLLLAAVVVAFASPAIAGDDKFHPAMIKCKMTYNLKGWSLVYAQSKGEGRITCSNGASAHVTLKSYGGGLTVGKSEVIGGWGRFSEVRGIDELFGAYARAEAHAGAGEAVHAMIVTKGEVSLALSGTGKGVDIGIAVGNFVITRQ